MKENKYLKWLSSATDSVYWNDSAICDVMDWAFSNGAVGATTNPSLANITLKSDAGFWKDKLTNCENMSDDERAEERIKCVARFYSEKFMDLYRKNPLTDGFICAQTNPNKSGDAEYMIEQAKRYAEIGPNVVVKLPATKAGIKAYEECAALGINVAATVSMTVPQVIAAAEAAERGKARAVKNGIKPGLSIAVLMVGRLDNYLRDIVMDSELDVRESDIIQAGTACIKRAYKIFQERNFDTYLMPAGCRTAANIADLAGAKMIMSIAPKIAELLESVDEVEEKIDKPVDEDVINRLMQIDEFRRAYEPDGLRPDEFIKFGGNNRTTAQFIECGWNLLYKD